MMKFFLATILLVISNDLLVQAQETKGDTFFQEGKDWLDKGNNEKAIKSFLAARAQHLKTENYYRYFIATDALSIMYQELGDGKAAEKIIVETITNIPKNSPEQFELHAKLKDNLGYTYLVVLNELEKAIDAYTQAIAFYENAGKANSKSIAFELVNRALVYKQLSELQRSIDDLTNAITIYEKEGTAPQELANNYYTLGQNYSELEEFDKALENFQHGIKLLATGDKSETHAMFYNAMGYSYSAQHKYQRAIENYELAKNINVGIVGKEAENYCQNVANIAEAYRNMGDWESALINFQEVLTIYQKTPPKDLDNVIQVLVNISKTMTGLGMSEKAQAVNEQTLAFATSLGKSSLGLADVYRHLAVTAFNHNEIDKSLNYNFKVISILDANNFPKNGYYASIYDAIAQAYDVLEDIDLALKYKQQAKDLYIKTYGATHSEVAIITGSMGLTYEMARDNDKAIDYLQQSVTLLLKSVEFNNKELGVAYMDMGRIYLKKEDLQKASEFLEKAREIFDVDFKSFNKAKVYNELGAAYFYLNNITKAAQCFQQAIIANTFKFEDKNFDSTPDKPDYVNFYELITSYISKADIYRLKSDKGNLLKGLQQLESADKLIKETSIDFSNPADRLKLAQINSFFTEAGLQLTDKLFSLTHDATYLEKAFYFSERSKSNELYAAIQLSRASSLKRIPKEILSRRTDISAQLNSLQQQIASAYTEQNQSLIAKLKTQEFDLSKELETIQSKMIALSPKLAAINNKRSIPTWGEIKKTLDAKTILVSYSITDSAKYILIGNATTLVVKKINPTINLEKIIRAYINQIKFKEPSYKQIAETLTNILWVPVEEAMITLGENPEKIIILPEGPLNYLPFESLGKENFLVEKYTIHYSLSGALLLNSDKNSAKQKPSFIAMAPVFEDKETNFVNKSCERFVEYTRKADTTSRAFSLKGNYITPLPATRIEVEKLNQIHLDKGIITKFFIEEDAHEALIKKGELEKYDYIHLATHGFVNTHYPELSGLLLTQDANSPEDGVLYTGEIVGLNLNAQLVTLSACETALGKKIEGEGVRGLSTAFIFAGAKNVIASLWKVSDQSTSELMIAFYTELLLGKDKATSLKLAKLNLINTEAYHHPYYWAPFVQIGGN